MEKYTKPIPKPLPDAVTTQGLKNMVTEPQIKDAWGLSRNFLRAFLKPIPRYRLGDKTIRYKVADLENYIEQFKTTK